jgi:endo-1,4-beta-mannosidase
MEGRRVYGFNYNVRTAVNDIEQWQAATFDLKTIDQEFGWAEKIGYTSVRVFLSYTVWLDDPPGFRQRLGQFLDAARRHGLSVMPVLFSDGEYTGRVAPQPDPVPGVHNSRAVVAPGVRVALDPQQWPPLKAYVRDIVGSFGSDNRIILWDVYNEPGNSPAGDKVLPLVEAVFQWARESRPTQPLTAGPWLAYDSPFSQRLITLSDVVTFHNYESPDKMKLNFRGFFAGQTARCR